MSAGVEMLVPYIDDEMVGLTRRMPLQRLVRTDIGVRKYILRRLALRRFGPVYSSVLVDVVLREKLGIPSSGVLLMQDFEQMRERLLPADYLARHELGFCFTDRYRLLMFGYFCAAFLEHRGDVAAVGDIRSFIGSRSEARA